MDAYPSPSPGLGAGHCWAGSLEVLRTTHCSDGLSGHQPWALGMGWEPALGPQMLPSACSQLRGGPVGLPLHSDGVANSSPCFISLSESLVVPALLAKP